ncbi:Regulatory protein cys-3 [Cladobotryum mycophilum]|uniref:Regulatory protein cys-3 n=1 Tax=Cladobotryum mycophilum TaxID=491253 RepID=A0ABR0SZG5_9HYPO
MSNYSGRHGPNVSQYLRDLNAISPQEASVEEPFNMEEDLALFTNTQFFDFDSGQNTDFQAQPVKPEAKGRSGTASEDVSAAPSVIGEMPNLDFMSDFNFTDFGNTYAAPHMNNFPESTGAQSFPPLQPNHRHVPVPPQQAQYHQPAPPSADKRKSEQPLNLEEASRMAAEEDKRRRNTAASARFRIKKKQREQALEKSAKEMSDKVSALENRVSQLETENKWLKNLLVDKNEGSDDIVALWKEFTKHASEKTKPTAAESSTGSEKSKEER